MICNTHSLFYKNALRRFRLKATPARLSILEVFEHNTDPLAIKDIAKKVKGSDIVTLYRNVEALTRLGFLVRVNLNERDAHYELTKNSHHHHIICESCGKLEDIESCRIVNVEENILKSLGFNKIKRHSLEFFGICNSCAKA